MKIFPEKTQSRFLQGVFFHWFHGYCIECSRDIVFFAIFFVIFESHPAENVTQKTADIWQFFGSKNCSQSFTLLVTICIKVWDSAEQLRKNCSAENVRAGLMMCSLCFSLLFCRLCFHIMGQIYSSVYVRKKCRNFSVYIVNFF